MDLDTAKEEMLTLEAVFLERLPDGTVMVETGKGHKVIAQVSGKFRKRHIRLETGVRVQVEIFPHDMNRGRLVSGPIDVQTPPPPPPPPPSSRRKQILDHPLRSKDPAKPSPEFTPPSQSNATGPASITDDESEPTPCPARRYATALTAALPRCC